MKHGLARVDPVAVVVAEVSAAAVAVIVVATVAAAIEVAVVAIVVAVVVAAAWKSPVRAALVIGGAPASVRKTKF